MYRAVDKQGLTVDFYLSAKRDVNAAKTFLRKAMNGRSKSVWPQERFYKSMSQPLHAG